MVSNVMSKNLVERNFIVFYVRQSKSESHLSLNIIIINLNLITVLFQQFAEILTGFAWANSCKAITTKV